MLGLFGHGAAAFAAASGDELGVAPGNRRNQSQADAGEAASGPEAMRGAAMGRVYVALWRAAQAGQPCPGNRALGALAGIAREAKVQRALRALERKRLIVVERSAEEAGARRVVIRASGRATGWSLGDPGPAEPGGTRPAGGGMRAFAGALKRAGGRFRDVTPAEARRISSDTPADPGLPPAPAPASYAGCALAPLLRPDPPEGEGEAAAAAVP